MLLQMQSQSPRPFYFKFNKSPTPTKIHPPSSSSTPFSIRVSSSTTSPPKPSPSISVQLLPSSPSQFTTTSPVSPAENVGFRPTPELGLLSHLFVFSVVFSALFSVALISIPILIAFGRLGNSAKKLSKVVSEEVPGTLSSLKLSSLELSDLTQQLSSLRHIISGVGIGNKDRSSMRSRSFRKKKPSS